MSKIEDLKLALKNLGREYATIKTLPESERKAFGEKLNAKKSALLAEIKSLEDAAESESLDPIDITAPFGENAARPTFRRGT